MNYFLHLVILIEIYSILALSLNLIIGYNGILSLAHSAFYGIGAYSLAIILLNFNSIWLAVLCAILLSALSGFILALSASRFKGDIFILVTLAFQVVFYSFVYNATSITKGPYGITGITRFNIFNDLFGNALVSTVILYGVIAVLVIIIFKILLQSNFALSLKAIRDNELAAIGLGKNIVKLKVKSFILSAIFASLAGMMYASYITFIDPTSFTIDESILIISMVIVGGTGNFKGPLIGAVVLIIIPEILRYINISDSIASNIRLIMYGSMLVILMMFKPQGIAGKYNLK